MGTKLSREGRWLDIVLFTHMIHVALGEGTTVGHYAKMKGLGKSPYLYGEFEELVSMGILYKKAENYKADIRNIFWVNYDNITEFYPQIHEAITAMAAQNKLL